MRRRSYLALLGVATAGAAGCTGGGAGDDDGGQALDARKSTFRDHLEDAGMEVLELAIEDDGTVTLEYEPGELTPDADEAQIEARIEETVDGAAHSFFDRVYGGWDVEFLDASVFVAGTLVVTWHMDGDWIDEYLAGAITREEMADRVEASVEQHEEGGTGTPYESDAEDGSGDG